MSSVSTFASSSNSSAAAEVRRGPLIPAQRRARPRPVPSPAIHLPTVPTEEEKYSYFCHHRRWPFVWLFVSQLCLVVAFVFVMIHSVATSLGLVLLTFMVPPMIVNLWLRMRRRRVTLDDHCDLVGTWQRRRAEYPSVDILLPVCGEDPVVLDNTFRHVARVSWPGELTIHVLDDADDPATHDLALSYGFDYVVRPNRGEWKKAGNLINAFDNTDGEFLAVFDADFCPRPDFLFETVPYMDEPRTGVVQTAQFFDVDHRVNEFGRYAGTLQELFFRWIQPARDTYEAAICAGTNVLYRRAAVVAAGGFAKVPLGEDVHSGVKIWVANYRTRYVPLVLAKGLAPDTWSALTNQQYRWCRSSLLLMMSTFFQDAPFGWRQRLCFWAAFLYYMSSAAMLLTATLPTAVMLWLHPQEIQPSHYLIMVPAIIGTLFVFPLLARGWRPTIYRVCTINTFCHALACYDALRNQVQAWVPTGASAATKKKAGVPSRIAWIGRTWFAVTQTVLWAGIVHYVLVNHDIWRIWPLVALTVVQAYMLAPVLLTLRPTDQRRAARRMRRASQPAPLHAVPSAALAMNGAETGAGTA